MSQVQIIGIGGDGLAGLRPQLVEVIHRADFLAGGERHLAYFPQARGERFLIKNNLSELVSRLKKRLPKQQCVVLASGDPLFYGIGNYLLEELGSENLDVDPAPS